MHALPPTVFLVFLEMAVGGYVLLLWAAWQRLVSRGFVLFSVVMLWLSAALALWVREGFPLTLAASQWRGLETVALVAFVVLLAVYGVLWQRNATAGRQAVGSLTAITGTTALVAAALVHASAWGSLASLVSFLLGAVALGGSMVAMVLGHWYLVTPTLSTRPLIGMTVAFLAAAALQGILLPLELGMAGGEAAQLDGVATLLSTYSFAFGLRVFVGILLPVALAAMTWQTCRLRSMMSATGLLYIAVSCVLAGEIAAKTLFFLTGIPT